jgi:hypothetical protein
MNTGKYKQNNMFSFKYVGYCGMQCYDNFSSVVLKMSPSMMKQSYKNMLTNCRYGPHTEYKLIYFPASALY